MTEPDLTSPEPSDAFTAIIRTGDGLGETPCLFVDVSRNDVSAPVAGMLTMPVPLEDFRPRSDGEA